MEIWIGDRVKLKSDGEIRIGIIIDRREGVLGLGFEYKVFMPEAPEGRSRIWVDEKDVTLLSRKQQYGQG